MTETSDAPLEGREAAPAVRLEGFVKRYSGSGGPVTAVGGVSLEIGAGEIFGMLGPNGAGKTTTIETIAGLRAPTEGSVRVLGLDPVRERDALRRLVSIQPQHAAVFKYQTVAELLTTWASFYKDHASPDEVISMMGLESSRDVRSAKLSGGQRQRLLVGTALISKPSLLVLDEPSTGMDPNAREELWEAVRVHRDNGGTVLLSTHSMEEAHALCDRVGIMHQGKLVACGAPDELVRAHAPEQELVFTVPEGSDLSDVERHEVVQDVCVSRQGVRSRVRVRTREVDQVLSHLLGGPLDAKEFQTNEASLEDVFRHLTGQEIGDDGGGRRANSTQAAR